MNELNLLKERWLTTDGQQTLKTLLAQRFFLDTVAKQRDVCNRHDLINDLRGINLSERELTKFLLFDTDIRWGNFSKSVIRGNFQDADLSYVNFEEAFIEDVTFWKAKVIECKFNNSSLLDTDFEESDVRETSFKNVKLNNVGFHSSDLRGANFEGATFVECTFYKVKLDAHLKTFWDKYGPNECNLKIVEWC